MIKVPVAAGLCPYRELTITSEVQEFCGRKFPAKLGEFNYSKYFGGLYNVEVPLPSPME